MDDACEQAALARQTPADASDASYVGLQLEAASVLERARSDATEQSLSVSESSVPVVSVATSVPMSDSQHCPACISTSKGRTHTCGKARRSFKRPGNINSQAGGRPKRARLQSHNMLALELNSLLDAAQQHDGQREASGVSSTAAQVSSPAAAPMADVDEDDGVTTGTAQNVDPGSETEDRIESVRSRLCLSHCSHQPLPRLASPRRDDGARRTLTWRMRSSVLRSVLRCLLRSMIPRSFAHRNSRLRPSHSRPPQRR